MNLEHLEGEKYQLICSRVADFTRITSLPQTFNLKDVDEAIAFGKALINQDLDFNLFQGEMKRQQYLNECKSNLATLDSEYTYDF